ncbi:MAG: beta-N-acetylhexosaminidase, partial [Lysobacteraceae bacterium]
IGMAAAESAGGVQARIDAHLDAGCDVVLVCAPALVDDSLKAFDSRGPANTAAFAGLMGRGALGWQGLLADARRPAIQSALAAPPFTA